MKIICYTPIRDFRFWSGAEDTMNRVIAEEKCDALESILIDLYPDGISEYELNNLLRFDSDTVYEWLGMKTEAQVMAEIDDIENKIEDLEVAIDELMVEYHGKSAGLDVESREKIFDGDFLADYDDLQEELSESITILEELKEDLKNIRGF